MQQQVLAWDHPQPELIPDPAPIAQHVRIGNDSEDEGSVRIGNNSEDEGPSDSEGYSADFVAEPLIDEERLFQDGDEAAGKFPEFFEADEEPTSGPGPGSHYNLDSQEGREGAADLLDFNYEYLTLLTPQELVSIALYKIKMKNNFTHEGYKDCSRLFSEQSGFPYLDVRTVHKIIRSTTGVAHVSYDVCVNNCICFAKHPERRTCPCCGEARYRRVGLKDVPRKSFDYIPAQHRLRLLYSDPKMAGQLKSYRKKLVDTAEGDILRNFWDAKL